MKKIWMTENNEVFTFHYNRKGERVDIRKAKMVCNFSTYYVEKPSEPVGFIVRFEDDYGNVLGMRLEIVNQKVIKSNFEATEESRWLIEKIEYTCKGIVNECSFETKVTISHRTMVERYSESFRERRLNKQFEVKNVIKEYTFEEFLKVTKPTRRELCRIAYPYSKNKDKTLRNICERFWDNAFSKMCDFSKICFRNDDYYIKQQMKDKNVEFCLELEKVAKEAHKNHL